MSLFTFLYNFCLCTFIYLFFFCRNITVRDALNDLDAGASSDKSTKYATAPGILFIFCQLFVYILFYDYFFSGIIILDLLQITMKMIQDLYLYLMVKYNAQSVKSV